MKTGYFYAYILRSKSEPPHFYTGFTENLDERLKHHNSGGDPHTAKYPQFPRKCNYVGSVRPKTSMILRWMGLVSV